MLRGFLIFWLLISNLGYGMAVLADLHDAAMPDSENLHSQDTSTQGRDHQGSEQDCDHCCHGLIHLLGLLASDAPCGSVSLTEEPPVYTTHASTPPPLKRFRPPIAV